MNSEFIFGLIISVLIVAIALLWTGIVYLRAVIMSLKYEIEKLKAYIYEIIDSTGRGDNEGRRT